jgi:hypothetical protein
MPVRETRRRGATSTPARRRVARLSVVRMPAPPLLDDATDDDALEPGASPAR